MFKKLFVSLLLVLTVGFVAACAEPFKVTFDPQNGDAVSEVEVKGGKLVAEPADEPVKAGSGEVQWSFTGWYTDPATPESAKFNFQTPINADITLYAGYSQDLVVRFNSKTAVTVPTVFVEAPGGDVAAPNAPTRDGYNFGGWYMNKAGQTWNEPSPVVFPLHVTESIQLHAFWVPVNSKAVSYSDDETFKSSFTELDADPILNPLVYKWSHESDLLSFLSTPLYGTDVNWDQAISDGLAAYAGDFSKLNEDNIGSLLRQNVLYGAAQFPIAVGGDYDGEDGTDQHGKFSEIISREIMATTYEYKLREDVYWENGDPVTAHDYYFSYFQYIDPIQGNYRASTYFPNASRSSGMRVVNARNYYLQGSEIGLGESSSNPLAGDYGQIEIKRYLGPNNPYGPEYEGQWIFSSPGDTVYITQAQLDALGLAPGKGIPYPEGIDFNAATIANYDFYCDISINPYYIGPKGDNWPAITKDEVGFEIVDDYTFRMTFEVPTSHSSAIANGDFTLVHKATYQASLDEDGRNSTYGTSVTRPVSYGAYVLKDWDTGQKMVFNKNYNSIMHKYHNYKSRSIEFYSNTDQRMTAFEEGLLSVTGLNQTYYNQYLNHPNKKDSYNGYPQYLMFNTVEYDGQDEHVAEIIKEKEFRQAFFFGFNRIEFANTIYAPNKPTLLVFSSNATQYDNDPQWYVNTPEYEDMLDGLGIDLDTYGYDPTKAKALFDKVYADWLAFSEEGHAAHSGKIKLNYLTSEGAEMERIDNYIINHYTNLFGADKIEFVVDRNTSDVASDKQDDHKFDITLTAVGTGTFTNLSVMLPIVGLFFQETYGDMYGFNTIEDLNIPTDAFLIDDAHKLDLRSTWNYLKTVTDKFDEETDGGTLWPLWEILNAHNGYFVGNLSVLFDFGLECTFIWAGLVPQYDGDVDDRNTVTRAFDAIILEYAPLIPTAGRASSSVYADNVKCLWPAYHNIMGWGQSRYWYLSSDPDFQ